jgi:trans-aconitate 2-methyltransferase
MLDHWSPGAHLAFRDFRLRPALDLSSAVPEGLPAGDVVDLGCGSGSGELVLSNACLQWLPDHARLMPRLAGLLAPCRCRASTRRPCTG